MTFIIGCALGSCKVEPDVVFEKLDASDAGSDASSDSETAMLDSGSNISESGVNDQDGTIPVKEGAVDRLNTFECPENKVFPEDVCMIDMTEMPTEWRQITMSGYNRFYDTVESIEHCIPSYLEEQDFETTSDNPYLLSPCPQFCEAFSNNDIAKLISTIGIVNRYYVDPNDSDILVACPLTCEAIKCWDDLLPQIPKLLSSLRR
jgi:hypothetical protein